VSIGK